MQRLFSLLAMSSYARAAVLEAAGILMERQDTVSYTTYGYTSAGMEQNSTIWAPSILFDSELYITVAGSYFGTCPYGYSYTTVGTSDSSYVSYKKECPVFTTCSLGVMVANLGSSTSQCAGDGFMCGTVIVYLTWGATIATTSLNCVRTGSDSVAPTLTMWIRKPDAIVSLTTTQEPTSGSTPTPAPALTTSMASETISMASETTSMASETATVNKNTSGGGSNNAGVIAGATIGGLAVVGLIGVAVLYILKRSKRSGHQVTAADDYPVYQPEKQPRVQQHYDPHKSTLYSQISSSPHTHSVATSIPEGQAGGDYSGLLGPSPQQPQPRSGSPIIGDASSNGHL